MRSAISELVRTLRDRDGEAWAGLLWAWVRVVTGRVAIDGPAPAGR